MRYVILRQAQDRQGRRLRAVEGRVALVMDTAPVADYTHPWRGAYALTTDGSGRLGFAVILDASPMPASVQPPKVLAETTGVDWATVTFFKAPESSGPFWFALGLMVLLTLWAAADDTLGMGMRLANAFVAGMIAGVWLLVVEIWRTK